MQWLHRARRLTQIILAVTIPSLWADEVRLEVREPLAETYLITKPSRAGQPAGLGVAWLLAERTGSRQKVLLGSRVVVQLQPGVTEASVFSPDIRRTRFSDHLWILEANDVAQALSITTELMARSEVITVHPVRRRLQLRPRSYAPRPNDALFSRQWHLDNRDPTTGKALGIDLNVRSAWAVTRGAPVIVAVADSGFPTNHPDLGNSIGRPHYDFFNDRLGEPLSDGSPEHGTSCAGLIAATGNNNIGVVGVAPESGLASWPIFGLFDFGFGLEDVIADDAALAKMLNHDTEHVWVQNHSWGSTTTSLTPMDVLSDASIEAAVTSGRSGLGVIFVRACGNEREQLINSIDDGFASDPRVVPVAAVRADGRATTYSSPGANILVGAPSGDPVSDTEEDPIAPNIVTTDLVGAEGYNTDDGKAGDYALGASGFSGTSASSPEISGVCALILGANSKLGYRDVQQILVHASRHFDFADSDVRTNAAGFVVSHNVGFGVPDAGYAVQLAKHWSNRPALKTVRAAVNTTRAIVSDSLRLELTGPALPSNLSSVHCLPSQGPHAEMGTGRLALVYVGLGNTNIPQDLHGKGALIQRGDNFFYDKIQRAAQAGAEYAVIYNNVATQPQLIVMFATAFTPIPAIFVNKSDGDALRNYVTAQPGNTARLVSTPTTTLWTITNSILCEQVGVRLKTTHSSRGDLRITLVSPAGTRSVLQFINDDGDPGPRDWTYWTTHCFFESGTGVWRLDVTDERALDTGSITSAELIVRGTAITDVDHDGLDDDWERRAFGDLRYGAKDDPDGDGMSNAREQCLTTNPARYDPLVPTAFENVAGNLVRITVPVPSGRYGFEVAPHVDGPYTPLGTLTNAVPYVEFFAPQTAGETNERYVRVRTER